MTMNWKDYQEEAAKFFCGLGLDAQTDVTVKGARTTHDVDVLVKSHHAGFDVTWMVECKQWNTKVSKLHVLALREIVTDTGADRGILLSESGFQSGAIEAASLTNVLVTSLAEARVKSEHDVNAMRLRDFYGRVETCRERYWEIPKDVRIEYCLRPDVGNIGYSGNTVITAIEELLVRGLRGKYPFVTDTMSCTVLSLPASVASSTHLLQIIDPLLTDLESRLGRVPRT
ncbi:MAG: restriction endonuclease [Verrucomicrobiia bacterium]